LPLEDAAVLLARPLCDLPRHPAALAALVYPHRNEGVALLSASRVVLNGSPRNMAPHACTPLVCALLELVLSEAWHRGADPLIHGGLWRLRWETCLRLAIKRHHGSEDARSLDKSGHVGNLGVVEHFHMHGLPVGYGLYVVGLSHLSSLLVVAPRGVGRCIHSS